MTAAGRIVDLYRRHAGAWAAARGTELRERGWIERFAGLLEPGATVLLGRNGFDVVAHIAEDPACGGHTVWLAQRR
jgi:hypothetical protein